MKDMKIRHKLLVGFIVIDIALIFCILSGYSTARKLVTGDLANPDNYVTNYGIFCVVLFLLMACVMTYLTVSVLKTIRVSSEEMIKAAKRMAVGDVEKDMVKHCDDEFGEMIDEYQQVIENIRAQTKIANEVANGNLTVVVTPKSERDTMGIALKKMVDKNYHALSSINDAAYQVLTSSSQVASASEALAQGSTEQASAIEQITASINDVSDKTRENAAEADKAAGLMRDAIVNVEKGAEDMQEMMEAMQEINASSESISKIIKVIDDIAFQTIILALNAAVEAARAGEAGKGFAVVAEEVRNLAAKSAAAASETAELIEDSIAKVEAGSQIATATSEAIEQITRVVQESEKLVGTIAEASNYQATAISQVNQAIEQVSQVVQNNSATSEECAAASIELSNQSGKMTDLISIFDLGSAKHVTSNMPATSYSTGNRNEQIISLGNGFGKY